jgi:hypothetical protein
MINEWRIDDIPGIETESLKEPATIGCIKSVLENKNLSDIALLDNEDRFLSIITKENVIEQIVTKLSL